MKEIILKFTSQEDYEDFVKEISNDFKDEPGVIVETETSITFTLPDSVEWTERNQ